MTGNRAVKLLEKRRCEILEVLDIIKIVDFWADIQPRLDNGGRRLRLPWVIVTGSLTENRIQRATIVVGR